MPQRALANTTLELLDLALVSLAEAAKCTSVGDTKLHITKAAATISQVMVCAMEELGEEITQRIPPS
jgi:tRNA-binding EMAP/Myf-like protein